MKKLTTILLLATFVPFITLAQASDTAASDAAFQKQIQELLKLVQSLQQQVTALQAELGKQPEKTPPAQESSQSTASSETTATPESLPPELTRNLSRGSSGDDVRRLQEFLAQDKDVYPEGLRTGFYGPLTEIAVKKWQTKHGVESIGVIGPKTLAKFQELGKGVVQGLLTQGAGSSGVVPPGLLHAPGIGQKIETPAATMSAT